jgi:hypothetical protein
MATHIMNDGSKVVTSNIFPPIPLRQFDWCAYFGGEEEGLTGYGATEADAIDDLTQLWEEAQPEPEDEREPFDHQTAAWDRARDLRKHS